MRGECSIKSDFDKAHEKSEKLLFVYIFILRLISINLLVFYHECRSLIGYATRYLFCNR